MSPRDPTAGAAINAADHPERASDDAKITAREREDLIAENEALALAQRARRVRQ